MAKAFCKHCKAINLSIAPTCHNCGERIASFPAMPLDAALDCAESRNSTGGIMAHEALKTLAAAIRGRRCEFCKEIPLTETERKFILEND